MSFQEPQKDLCQVATQAEEAVGEVLVHNLNAARHPPHLHDRPDAGGRGGADGRGCWGER